MNISQGTIEKIRTLSRANVASTTIANKLKMKARVVAEIRKRNSFPRPSFGRLDGASEREITELYQEGYSVERIASELYCSKTWVCAVLKKYCRRTQSTCKVKDIVDGSVNSTNGAFKIVDDRGFLLCKNKKGTYLIVRK